MTGFKTGARARSGLKQKFMRLFRERELILRSEGKVRYLRLKPIPQMVMTGTALTLSLWLAGANGIAWLQEMRIERKEAEITEARVAYERLRGELSTYQNRIASLAKDILAHSGNDDPAMGGVNLDELTAVTAGIEGAFDRINRDLDLTEADRRRIIQSRDSLHDRIAELETALTEARLRVASLQTDVIRRDRQLEVERAEIEALTDSRDEWRGKAKSLDSDLASARNQISSLESELELTVAALTEERSRVEDLADIRTRLTRQVDSLESGLSMAEVRGERLASNVAQLTENLKALESERVAMAGERESLTSDLAIVEAELSLHQTATERSRERLEAVIVQLAELTDGEVGVESDVSGALQALEVQIGDLAAELRAARNNAADMETAIGDVVVGLARVAGDSPTRLDLVEAPEAKVSLTHELLNAVASVQEDQHELILRLTEEADGGISRNESILKMAGVDVDALLRLSGYEAGVGGPLEIMPEDVAPSAGPTQPLSGASVLAGDIEILESRLSRMAALNELMRCVPLISPVDNFQMTSPFGPRKDPITGQTALHKGIDIGGWAGIKVHASAPGIVTFAGRNGGYGYMVEIDHGCGIKTVYAHLKRVKVKKGDTVEHRMVVGTLGSTGRSTGPHVHFEIIVDGKEVDPEKFIEAGRHVHKI
jgi:murein DD-endopeptidase MepM/ murein hydrolase activator NlpD